MKIALASDLHLEFGTIELTNDENADVLILSGDICVASKLNKFDITGVDIDSESAKYHKFFEQCCEQFPEVIYIAGNHEHYGGDFQKTIGILKEHLSRYKNLHILDKETFECGDFTFIGATLWSDFNRNDAITMMTVERMMNDFRLVENSSNMIDRKVTVYRKDENGKYVNDENGVAIIDGYEFVHVASKLKPEDCYADHQKFLACIESVIKNDRTRKYVIVGHHSPSSKSIHPRYESSSLINGAYSSNLEGFIMNYPEIKLWTHGHTHHEFDYDIGETRISCNPRGYIGREAIATNYKLKYIDL